MAQFRKKPVVIDAELFTLDNWKEMEQWSGGRAMGNWKHDNDVLCIRIKTLEGMMTAMPGDWIIKGIKGEFYPCKPDIFAASYEALPPPATRDTGEA